MFIQRETLFNMVGAVSKGMEELSMAMLWLASYTFLLRVPSEGLPMCRGGVGYTPLLAEQSLLYMDGHETACLKLHARKSQPRGALLKRTCSCAGGNSKLCPVHALWHGFFIHLEPGTKPWGNISPDHARCRLRDILRKLQARRFTLSGPCDNSRVPSGARIRAVRHARFSQRPRQGMCVYLVPVAARASVVVSSCAAGHATFWRTIGKDMPDGPMAKCGHLQVP